MSIRIDSRENSLVKRLVRLSNDRKFRKEMQEMVCEGEKMLGEALSSGMDIHDILVAEDAELDTELLRQAEEQGAKLYICPSSLLGKVSNVKTPQGVVFTCRLPRTECPQTLTGARYLALDGVQDPGNVGTILRTLDAFEADGLVLLPGCADPFSPKTVRSSMGAVFRRPVWTCTVETFAQVLRGSGLRLLGAALRDDTVDARAADYTRAVLAIGSEGRGLSDEVLALCDETVRIPMSPRCESLNAAVAASVLLWEAYR